MSDLIITKKNEAYMKVICEPGVAMEISDAYSFYVPNYRWAPKYKAGVWDGKIRLFNTLTREMYAGLKDDLADWAKKRDYTVEIEDEFACEPVSIEEFGSFLAETPKPFEPNEHQRDAVLTCIDRTRCIIVSPTASGKSFILYLLSEFYKDKKILIVVPTINLVDQMHKDFISYGCKEKMHCITAGVEKTSKARIWISTWQSITEQKKPFYTQFDVIMGDECHEFSAKSLIKIMTNAENIKYRYGFTGSLDGKNTNLMTLTGLFGKVKQVVTTHALQLKGIVAKLKIVCVVLKYPEDIRKACKKMKFEEEKKYLCSSQLRNRFITKLVLSLKGRTIILFDRVETHGVPLYEMCKAKAGDRPVYFVSGQTPREEREEIRQLVNEQDNAIVFASVVWTRGVNIPEINNLVTTSPIKSQVRVLQTIGRGLRKTKTKSVCTLYDIADDISWKSRKNHSLKLLLERIKIYAREKFSYVQQTVVLTDDRKADRTR
jgi:superfamily II DNA or RNA helicase